MKTFNQFISVNLAKFNTPEYVTLIDRFDRFISQTQARGEEILHYPKVDMDRLKELFTQLQNNVARSMALAETPELVAMDAERSTLGQYIITTVRNSQNLPIKAKAEAAKQLYAVLRAYVGFYNQPAPQKTATIDGMLLDLSAPEMQDHVTTLALGEYIESLTLKNAQYKVKVEARTTARAALHSVTDSATLRLEMDALYKYITTLAFAHNVVTPSEDIAQYIVTINAIIGEANSSYNQRMAAKTERGKGNQRSTPGGAEVKTENSVETGNGEVSPEGSEPSEEGEEAMSD